MMGQVIPFGSSEAEQAAWADFEIVARAIVEDPALLLDRAYHRRFVDTQARFRRAYLAQAAGQVGGK